MKSYLNIVQHQNTLHHWFIEDGVRKYEKVRFQPILGYVNPNASGKWRGLFEEKLAIKKFECIGDARTWMNEVEGSLDVYGHISWPFQFISFNYPNEIEMQKQAMRIYNIDIEVKSVGFPNPAKAEWPITAITVQDMVKNHYTVLAFKEDVKLPQGNVDFHLFKDEDSMMVGFVDWFHTNCPDIITGWHIEGFDIPYIVNRLKILFGDGYEKNLSPIRQVTERTYKGKWGAKELTTYNIGGVTTLDYIQLYKKFSRNVRESYTLDHVAKMELGEGKVNFHSEYDNLSDLYDNDFETYITYNIKDVELVYEIDQKLRFIDLIISMAYMAHAQFADCTGTVKIWDAYLFNEMLHKGILAPPAKKNERGDFPGGYVQDPVPGIHRWISVWDVASSYPRQTQTWNISIETIVPYESMPPELKAIRKKFGPKLPYNSSMEAEEYINPICIDVDALAEIQPTLDKFNVTFCANGEFYRKDKVGLIPEAMGKVFDGRIIMKKKMQTIATEIQQVKEQIKALEGVK